MKKDATLGLVTLFEPIFKQLNEGDLREKKLAEMLRNAQMIVCTVRSNIYFGNDDNKDVTAENLKSLKLNLITVLLEIM